MSPMNSGFWQKTAQNSLSVPAVFPETATWANLTDTAGASSKVPAAYDRYRYPSPSLWPDLIGVRPLFPVSRRRHIAEPVFPCVCRFPKCPRHGTLQFIKNLSGGISKCEHLKLSRQSLSRLLCRPALIPTSSAALPALRAVQLSLTPWAAARSPARLSAVLLACSATTRASAANRLSRNSPHAVTGFKPFGSRARVAFSLL